MEDGEGGELADITVAGGIVVITEVVRDVCVTGGFLDGQFVHFLTWNTPFCRKPYQKGAIALEQEFKLFLS